MPCSQESRFLQTGVNNNRWAPSMAGKNKGVVSLLQKHMENNEINNNIEKLQCLIHQKALCAKVGKLKKNHGRSVEDCKLYFAARIESLSVLTTTLRSKESVW